MRPLLASISLVFALGCSAERPQSGWEYRRAHGAYAATIYYRFADGEGTTLIGTCAGAPSFMLAGGAWEAPQFTLTVDGRSWTLPTRQGQHGHYLPVDFYVPQQAIANAKRRIIFQAGNWRRQISPDAPLTSFVADCT